jgi:PAS domain S-box-containing protein
MMSGYGFWQWSELPANTRMVGMDELYYLLCLVIIPLVLFLFLSVAAGQRLEYNRLSGSYQTRIDQLQKRLNAQEDLLHVVADYAPESITIFDKENHFWFINTTAANETGIDAKEIIGKPPVKIMNHDRARMLEIRLNEVRASNRPMTTLDQKLDTKGAVRFEQAHFEVVAPFAEFSGGVIVRTEDVTSLIVERERRENMLRQVIGTLVAVVDRRDPYASGHSARVGQLSRAIAEEMMLDEKSIEAAEVAGSLMNFGKVLVPREILTKTTALTSEELQRVRDSILTSADILSIIDFSGPVMPTLKQVLERYDGTGAPHGLKGEQILITARIVAVANTYVALVSPRAHRPSLEFKDAVQNMMRDAGKLYDRNVVVALTNYIENRSSKLDWLNPAKQA